MALDIEQAVWFREGQIVKFFMPYTNKERQIDQGVVVKVDLRDRMLHIQAAKMGCLLYTSPSPRDLSTSRMPSSA